jgi:bifunctional DNA-binding transcriptional regulator/antitoxin component of YhaV-PrlF toxin-antitoxin module
MIITVPKAIAKMKGWKKGTVLEWIEDRFGETVIKEVKE